MYRILCLIFFVCMLQTAVAQDRKDSADLHSLDVQDLDLLFSELDAFLDSLLKPQSFGSVSLGAGNRMISTQATNGQLRDIRVLMIAPNAGYYHKSGFGVGGSVSMLMRDKALKPAQYLATLSYDYLRNRDLMAGVAFTRFFAADSLDFYTSPLQNEFSGYFAYRKSWLKPIISVSYGWGTHTSVEEQETIIKKLRKKTITGTSTITTTEKVSDFSVSFALRHDFYKLKVFTANDHIRITPQIGFTGGTQRFGLNQSSQTFVLKGNSNNLKPFTSDNVALQESSKFQPLSLTAFLRTAYHKGKFFIQPQLIFDYYIPATENNWNTAFLVNTGFIF